MPKQKLQKRDITGFEIYQGFRVCFVSSVLAENLAIVSALEALNRFL